MYTMMARCVNHKRSPSNVGKGSSCPYPWAELAGVPRFPRKTFAFNEEAARGREMCSSRSRAGARETACSRGRACVLPMVQPYSVLHAFVVSLAPASCALAFTRGKNNYIHDISNRAPTCSARLSKLLVQGKLIQCQLFTSFPPCVSKFFHCTWDYS